MTKFQTYYNAARNKKDKLARNILKAFIENNYIFIPTSACFYIFTLAQAQIFILIQIFAFVLSLSEIYTNINLQKITKLVLKLFFKD